ncbi:TauD/TfdA dioxygenase family protein [Burkholderia dolosa]|uniref:TauD/TfdA dioxygenase family protein n=1 Tax=Burkholderia dolosa TaxID=152500 RepID=UPI0015909AF6|nr:TauD/TfdA family dioxygenase [Burkholderia dolosa]MBR8301266.1 TauD/TfdA family dioxygenase [Burkholderia dolosa]MBY4751180.1 TauD/TfdA family dioxygenase [Burkholderia dolosa]
MSLEVVPIDAARADFVGLASGIDLTSPVSERLACAIDAAMNRYAVLVFRGQPLTQDQQLAFARALGPLDLGFKRVARPHARLAYQELADISNVDESGQIAERTHRRIVGNLANQLWHSDSSFQQPAARYSMLHAVVVPESGGETEFADMRAAWDALDPREQRELEGLEAEHYALHSRFLLGDTDYSDEQRNALPPVRWPLVREHAGSGRRHLFIGAHATHIVGRTLAEGRVLLMDLLEHATARRFVYSHRWLPGDLVIWDNRCTLHRGRRHDLSVRRELRRATTIDVDRHVAPQAAQLEPVQGAG